MREEAKVLTAATIANTWISLYSANTMSKKSDTTPEQRAALEERVRTGEWLRVGDAAKVLNIGRTKMHTLASRGVVGYRVEAGSQYRQINPQDILKLLTESRTELRGPSGEVAS